MAPGRGLVILKRVSGRHAHSLRTWLLGRKDTGTELSEVTVWGDPQLCGVLPLPGGLSDPGLGGWVPKLGRDKEHPGLLEQSVQGLRCTEGNGNLGIVRTPAAREHHSWGRGGGTKPPSISFLPKHFVMLCDHFISTPWQFNFLGYVPTRA